VLIADVHGAQVYAAHAVTFDLQAQTALTYNLEHLAGSRRLVDLERFVAAQHLRRSPTTILFSGAGTVVQKLSLPPLTPRARRQAVHTRLTNYAGEAVLITDCAVDGNASTTGAVSCLAAGVDAGLARGLLHACMRAGLRVESMSTTAAALGCLADATCAVQILVADRSTTIQLFSDGLLLCREIPLGRQDLLAAYQRPILTPDGPVTLSTDEAAQLLREVGVPVGPPQEVRPGIHTPQLWPILTPVLRRFQDEIESTLEHTHAADFQPTALCVVAIPPIPGLGAHLASEFEVQDASPDEEDMPRAVLRAVSQPQALHIDLRPPEERLVRTLQPAALAAATLAALAIGLNAATPQPARAVEGWLAPIAHNVRRQTNYLTQYCNILQARLAGATAAERRTGRLLARITTPIDLVAPFKLVFGSRPPTVCVKEVDLVAGSDEVVINVECVCDPSQPAGVVSADWTRTLTQSPLVREAEVLSIADAGTEQVVHLRIVMR